MTNYEAVSIAEGFCEGEGASEEQQIEAWQHLIDTGLCWTLQGWFGRTAKALIDAGICHRKVKDDEKICKQCKKIFEIGCGSQNNPDFCNDDCNYDYNAEQLGN